MGQQGMLQVTPGAGVSREHSHLLTEANSRAGAWLLSEPRMILRSGTGFGMLPGRVRLSACPSQRLGC